MDILRIVQRNEEYMTLTTARIDNKTATILEVPHRAYVRRKKVTMSALLLTSEVGIQDPTLCGRHSNKRNP